MGSLVSEVLGTQDNSNRRHAKALQLCDAIKSNLIDHSGKFLVDIPASDLHHVQNVLYVCASIRGSTPALSAEAILADFKSIIEMLLRFDHRDKALVYSFRDLIIATVVASLILTSALPPSFEKVIHGWQVDKGIAPETGPINDKLDLLGFVSERVDHLLELLLSDSEGVLPTVFLTPAQATRLTALVFSMFHGTFPGLWQRDPTGENFKEPTASMIEEVGKISSSALLGIAKVLQEKEIMSNAWFPGFDGRVRSSPSFVLQLYYLAYCFYPSASTCNNMGILLSTIPWANVPAGLMGQQDGVSVHQLAREYYEEGLRIVSSDRFPQSKTSHPHLLTNYGSLLKELGDIESAII